MKRKYFLAFSITLYLVIILLSPFPDRILNTETMNDFGLIDSNISNDFRKMANYAEEETINFNQYQDDTKDNLINLDQSESDYNKTLNDVLYEFQPNVNVSSIYSKNEVGEGIENDNLIISLPSQGQYSFDGNMTEIQSQYIQNSGAENEEGFYSTGAINAGLSFERIEDVRSFEGSYAWKFFSSNTESMSYALYQKDIVLYNTDTKISYNYLLESNSSIQNIVNSSLIFDLVFDTCRIMVIHWHYTNINPPLIGENTTSPFIVYRLLENSSWNDEWNYYSLEISELFNDQDPYIPTTIKSVGIYVISPEFSECSMLIDNFEIETSVSVNQIELEANGIPMVSTGTNSGTFKLNTEIEDEITVLEYEIYWSHNSSFIINLKYDISVSGLVNILTENYVSINENETTNYTITKNNLSIFTSIINITYPAFWSIVGEIENFDILTNESLDDKYNLLSLNNTNQSELLYCEFSIPNLFESVNVSSATIFETVEVAFNFSYECTSNNVNILWESDGIKGTLAIFENETLVFTFPPWIMDGNLDVVFVVVDSKGIGFTNVSLFLERLPAKLQMTDQIVIPEHALMIINASYESLIPELEIEEESISAYLDTEIINIVQNGDQFQLLVSSYYLSPGDYLLEVVASSTTHASVIHTVSVNIYESEMEIEFSYTKLPTPSLYLVAFRVSSDSLPVGFAPIIIESSSNISITGILDISGRYSFEVSLQPKSQVINITCSIIKLYTVVASDTFEIIFEHIQAEISRSSDDVFISSNMSITYDIHYTNSHDKWYISTSEEMLPIINAFIQTDTSHIPVYIESQLIYWEIQASEDDNNHKLVITTTGPEMQISFTEERDEITCHFLIGSQSKSFSDVSLIYYLNDTVSSSKYQWNLFSGTSEEVSEDYNLQVNDLYVYYTNINLIKGSYLILDLVGKKISGVNNITNLVVPLVSSSGVLAGAITTVIKIYNKKKGMILEI